MPNDEQAATLADERDFVATKLLVQGDDTIPDLTRDTISSIHRSLADLPNETLADNINVIDDCTTDDSTTDEAIPEDGGELAEEPEILHCLADDLELAGLAGEQHIAQIIYLAATSRLFRAPLSVAVKGPSSGGKSHIVQHALRFLPQEACLTLTSASERALIYTGESLTNRVLVLYEADAIAKGGRGAYLLRTLLSEGE